MNLDLDSVEEAAHKVMYAPARSTGKQTRRSQRYLRADKLPHAIPLCSSDIHANGQTSDIASYLIMDHRHFSLAECMVP